MSRQTHTAQAIRDEVGRLFNAGRRVPTVPLTMPSDAFEDCAANWMIPAHPSFAMAPEAVKAAIVAVKAMGYGVGNE